MTARFFVVAGLAAASVATLAAQQPTFRSSVDLVVVEAQVVDSDGNPIETLTPRDFEVSVRGQQRRVVSANLERYERANAATGRDAAPAPRTFIIAIDTSSFDTGNARAPLEAARQFVSSLPAADLLGLHVYPNGVRLEPSTGRALVRQRLGEILGNRNSFEGLYHLRPSEVIDITASSAVANPGSRIGRATVARDPSPAEILANPVLGVQARECPDDALCASRIIAEASAMALHYEGQANVSLGGLQGLLTSLVERPGRKTVVLISGGVVVADRLGGRPDVGDLAGVMGRTIAAANATLYTIHVDSDMASAYGAGHRRIGDNERVRDRTLRGDWLDRFSLAAGGARLYVPAGAEFAFERVLRETSATYFLGVEPASVDRDGRPRELSVKVKRGDATVRARRWVVVPAKPAT